MSHTERKVGKMRKIAAEGATVSAQARDCWRAAGIGQALTFGAAGHVQAHFALSLLSFKSISNFFRAV